MNWCPECEQEYVINPFQSRALYERGGDMLCSSRCVVAYEQRQSRRAA